MITIPIEIGDVILTGKFKNHKVTVQEIGVDDYGLPTVNGKGIMKIRVEKLMPKKTQESTMRKINEAPVVNDPKIQKVVDEVNKLISSAIDFDGDPIPVVDKSSTWEEPIIYEPIVYQNGNLKITQKQVYGNRKSVDFVKKENMQFDGIPTLKDISKLYKATLKRVGTSVKENRISEDNEAPPKFDPINNMAKNAFYMVRYGQISYKNNKWFVTDKYKNAVNNSGGMYFTNKNAEDIVGLLNRKKEIPQKIYNAMAKKSGKNLIPYSQWLVENRITSKMSLKEVISKGVFINIKKEDGKFWFYIDTVDGPECISNVGFPTKEAAEHAALTKGFNVKKGGDAEDEMPETVEVPKPTKREKTPDTEKPKEIDLGKPKEIKLEEQIKRIIREEIKRVKETFQKKESLTEAPKITKKIEESLIELNDLQDKIAKAKAEIDAIMKRTGLKDLEKKSDDILKEGLWDFFEELKKDDQRIVKVKNIVMSVKRFQASPATYEHEKVLDYAMTIMNQDCKAKVLMALKATEKIGKTKGQVAFTTEGVGDIWNSIVNFLGKFIPSLKKKGKEIDAKIAEAEAQLANIK